MNNNADVPSPKPNAADHRRWLIGICISLIFGIFSAVMAWLSYADRTKPAAQHLSAPPAPTAAEPAPHGHGKGRGKD